MRNPIKDGEVRESKNGVAIVVGLWQDGDEIHIVSEGKFKTSVKESESSKRGRPNLYKHLKKLLQDHGKWSE